jgi:hypothetical protein
MRQQSLLDKCVGLHIKVVAIDDGRLFTIKSASFPSRVVALMLLLHLTLPRRKTMTSSS